VSKQDRATYRWRFFFVLLIFAVAVAAIGWRLTYLMVIDREFLLNQGDARTLRNIAIPAYRGMITDRNGVPLAISTPVDSIWVDPQRLSIDKTQLTALASLLELSAEKLQSKLDSNQHREFLYLKRRVNPQLAEKVQALAIPGVHLQREYKRYYPEGAVTAHILGVTNIDDRGQEGLELAFDEWLHGVPGKKKVLKDRMGNIVADVQNLRAPKPGKTLVLSIDRRIQYVAYQALQQAVEAHDAVSGSIVVLDVESGEVLAMVNQPTFNPNSKIKQVGESFRNRAVTDLFEPGSTLKAFSIASALDSGLFTPETEVDTGKGWMMVEGNTVRDIRAYGKLDLNMILSKSSNVGITKITLATPREQLRNMLERFGFGRTTRSGFPGERAGTIVYHRVWPEFVLATLAFGYGISVTPLQLANAYAIIAAGGQKRPVSFLRATQPVPGDPVISQQVATEVMSMLQNVVEGKGTASRARLADYHVAGKTGTARIAGPDGYDSKRHVASFVGIAPATRPKLVVAVVINEPRRGSYYGGIVATKPFKTVMSGALRILDIKPDNV
jgi:cell division protein FtsI (penicillin-binding protein 3)